jgi:hypothetical protein
VFSSKLFFVLGLCFHFVVALGSSVTFTCLAINDELKAMMAICFKTVII